MILTSAMEDSGFDLLDVDRFAELIDKTNALLKDECYTRYEPYLAHKLYKPFLAHILGLKSGQGRNYTEWKFIECLINVLDEINSIWDGSRRLSYISLDGFIDTVPVLVNDKFVEKSNIRYDKIQFEEIFDHVRFINCDFHNQGFIDCAFTYVEFINCNLSDAVFAGCIMTSCSFEKSYITHLKLGTSTLIDCDFTNAIDRSSIVMGTPFVTVYPNVRGLDILPYRCPESGEFYGWKIAKLDDGSKCMVKLLIPEHALRTSGFGNKCRCDIATVVDIQDLYDEPVSLDVEQCQSVYDESFVYRRGADVTPEDWAFDENRWNTCSSGIHFFMTRDEALNYYETELV